MPTLHWIGKDKVINHHHDVPFRVLDHQYTYDNGTQKASTQYKSSYTTKTRSPNSIKWNLLINKYYQIISIVLQENLTNKGIL